MANRKLRKKQIETVRESGWRVVRGENISGILFEVHPQSARIRIKRGRAVEVVDLRIFGVSYSGLQDSDS